MVNISFHNRPHIQQIFIRLIPLPMFPAKKNHNRANYVVTLGDARVAREAGHDDFFYCARPGCGPSSGAQCADCAGFTSQNPPPSVCYNRKGYEMIKGDDGNFYCGKHYNGFTKALGLNGGRCHPSKKWQCKHCQGFSAGGGEPPLHGRKDFSTPELLESRAFKSPKSNNRDI